jgi:hypothetical protein
MEQESRAVTQTLAFSEAEFNLYKFTFLQNAGYVIFLLLFNNFVEICNNGKEPASNSVLMETSLLFLAVLIGNFWSIYAGFESDARGHARCIRKSFDYGVIHGLFLAILPWLTTIIPGIYLYFSVFLAALFQAISSAYVNASYHAWFVASAHNLGYQGSLDPYTSRRRLTANLAWVTIGVLLLSILYFQGSRAPTHLTLSMAGFAIMLFYFIGSVKSRRLIFSGDLGSFETVGGRLKRVNIANNCLESFKNARMIMLGDRAVLGASTLFVVTWTLGVMVLYFWQKALQGDGSDWNFSKWAGIIWIGLTAGRIVGNSLAVLPDVAAPNVKARRLALGAWLAGGSMILFFAWRFMIHKTEWRFLDMWTLPLAVLLIFVNRIGQEIVLPFAYARIHESRHVLIAQNRASVESLLAVWTTPPLLITWGMVFMFEKWFHHPATLIVLVFGVLGLLLVLSSLLNKWQDSSVGRAED